MVENGKCSCSPYILLNTILKQCLKNLKTKYCPLLFQKISILNRAKDTSLLQPVRIKTEDVESVKTFKYLRTVLDSNLSFTTHVDTVCKKANQRMYLIRKLKTFDVDKKMLEMIYRSLVESILTFNIVTFYGHLTVKQKNRLSKIVNIATKLINLKQKSLNDLYQQAISKKSSLPTHYTHAMR